MKALWVMPAALVLAACTATAPTSARTPASAPTATALSAPTQSPSESPSATSRPSTTPASKATNKPKPHPISVQALINKKYDGRNLKVGWLLGDYEAYKRYVISYRGDGLKISGVMNVPHGKGPFPVLVLNHGYIDPDTYFAGQGMPREHDYLARHGYVVLHTDYRGHAGRMPQSRR